MVARRHFAYSRPMSEAPIVTVVGARPNFMKAAPVHRAFTALGVAHELVHTGQHYDPSMSQVFFDDLGLPAPAVHLGVGSGSHAVQTAEIMRGFETVCVEKRPRLVLVVGDVNGTVAAALVAAKLGIPVGHVEAGLRSGDWSMPEEVNRVVTDALSDLLFTPSADADENLEREGKPAHRVHRVGNVMIDSLLSHRARALSLDVPARFGLSRSSFAVLTLHRPSNVDEEETLTGLVGAVLEVAARLPVVFPVHPRTRTRLEATGLLPRLSAPGLHVVPPLGYLDFLGLVASARLVLTDSGGLQEETTALGVPCLTLRDNTERPITVSEGTNTVVGSDPARIVAEVSAVLAGGGKSGRIPDLWDGRAAERIAGCCLDFLDDRAG